MEQKKKSKAGLVLVILIFAILFAILFFVLKEQADKEPYKPKAMDGLEGWSEEIEAQTEEYERRIEEAEKKYHDSIRYLD